MTNEELVALIQSGQRDRLPELWRQVERFTRWRAGKMARLLDGRCGVTFEDLYQCGYLAFVKAVEAFSEDKGGVFLSIYDFMLRIEFATFGGWRTKQQKNDPLNNALSLDALADPENEDSSTLGELQPDPAAEEAFFDVEERERTQRLHNALEVLLQEMPEQQANVIRLRFYQSLSLQETGSVLGMSVDRVRSTEAKALRSFRMKRKLSLLRQHWE